MHHIHLWHGKDGVGVGGCGRTIGSEGQKLIVSLNFHDTTSDGKNLTCRVTTHGNNTYEEVVGIDVKGITI